MGRPRSQLRLFSREFTPAEARAFLEERGLRANDRLEETSNGGHWRKWRVKRGKTWKGVAASDVADVQQAQRVLAAEAARIVASLTPEQREAFELAKTGTDPK